MNMPAERNRLIGGTNMFDMMKISKKTKEARIAKNMTQMQLAEAMEVSFQAVSSWERGNSMPDISKLETLCNALDLSVEELLGMNTSAQAVKKVIGTEGETEPLTMEEIQEIAPILPPKELAEKVDAACGGEENGKTQEKKKINISALASIAPFMDSEDLLELMTEAEVTSLEDLIEIAPFLDEEDLGELAKRAGIKSLSDLTGLAPFLDEEYLGELALLALEENPEGGVDEIVGLAPFLEEEALDQIAGKLISWGKADQMSALYPFMESDTLKKIARVLMKDGNLEELQSILPFC